MSVMQIRCDCCGETIETGHHKLTLQCEPRPAISSRDSATSDPAINLCKPCFDELHEWFAESWSTSTHRLWPPGGSMDRSAVAVQRPRPRGSEAVKKCHLILQRKEFHVGPAGHPCFLM